MVSFVEDLWASVFTPGPTPTLLVAANATFAALQLVLFLLLLATYSIHFVVLSVLSASLWWSINWFAQELIAVQAQEAEKTQSKELVTDEDDDDKRRSEASRKTPGALDSTESDTETESLMERKISAVSAAAPPSTTTAAATLQPPEQQGGIRKRPSMSGESSGYVSTDSEWEKVDDKATA
ncbi:ER membrane protein (Pkr1) [Aspergillus nomiae NRRL 13137]|uniref:ER membrane protein (Pkr1) n=1 Tax=Aspergillus nomiae NRRL (strain ATCC 15546 / NRRL 13137 / CBS 260.88 / M93) TaxID=1509407 RepID=A0A0L1IWS2_ASPN3|nr:ER membrane protein (Pkr1) [Aspergillus nomiae NRRL 13137]KNG84001.1 ER membrane protein (Pkr1) [Aspergillus nomiae NRRL 13137]